MHDIALFPLKTVLFPGGLLPLRIFETRYVDMVGGCMRQGEVFGVVLIVDGRSSISRPRRTACWGCCAAANGAFASVNAISKAMG
jgi:hypothetical protein